MNPTFTNLTPITNDDGTISLVFSATDGTNNFTDAIVDTADNISAMTPDQILAEQTQRWNNWIAAISGENQ